MNTNYTFKASQQNNAGAASTMWCHYLRLMEWFSTEFTLDEIWSLCMDRWTTRSICLPENRWDVLIFDINIEALVCSYFILHIFKEYAKIFFMLQLDSGTRSILYYEIFSFICIFCGSIQLHTTESLSVYLLKKIKNKNIIGRLTLCLVKESTRHMFSPDSRTYGSDIHSSELLIRC